MPKHEELLTRQQVAELLQVHPKTVQKISRRLGVVYPTRYPRYLRSKVLAYALSRRTHSPRRAGGRLRELRKRLA